MKRLLILVLFISCSSYASGIKKWVDEAGQIHYGDNPPVQSESESIRVSRPPTNPGKALPRLGDPKPDTEQGTEADAPQTADAPPPPTKEEAQKQCEEAKKDLSLLKRSNRIRLKLDDGTSRYMSKEERDLRKAQSEKDIKDFCK